MDKMISNLADLPLDLLEDLHLWYWNLVVKMISNFADLPLDLLTEQSLPVLTSCGQDDFKFCRCNPRSGFRSTPWYLHLVVKMSSNLADLLLDLLEDAPFQYWHLVVKMISNLADLPPWYWHLTVKMSSNLADLPLDQLADQSPQHWHLVAKISSNLQIYPPSTDISWSRWVQIWQIYP